MREFEKSHPWVTFQADLRRLDHKIWIALGAAESKCIHIGNVLMKPALKERLHSTYLAKGIHSTSAIEGNTLSEEEVRKRIQGELPLPQSREYQGKEIDNILDGYNLVQQQILSGGPDVLTPEEIKNYNRIILKDLPLEDHVVPGEYRKVSVGVMGYRGAPANDCEFLVNRMCEWLNQDEFKSANNQIVYGIIRAIIAHLYLAWIHPFGDGNGRSARLIELKIMLAAGAPAPAAHLLSNHYNRTRTEYYRQLDYASKSKGDIFQFIQYAVVGLLDGLQEQLLFIHTEQLKIFWRDYVYEVFGSLPGKVDMRKRRLALDLAEIFNPLKIEQIREISPKVAQEYAGKTTRTIQRDLDSLKQMGLVVSDQDGYRANLGLLSQYFAAARRPIPAGV
ncbi:MAG: Fic family protein [Oligoflexia bacterium]|nr:Fic family protein [Oligoflexia bacterium]